MRSSVQRAAIGAGLLGIALTAYFLWKTPSVPNESPATTPNLVAASKDFSPDIFVVADEVADRVVSNFPPGWATAQVEDIGMAVRAAVPVLSATGFQEYYRDLENRGLHGHGDTIRARYDQLIGSTRWKQLVDAGMVDQFLEASPSEESMAKMIIETNHLYFDDALLSVDLESVSVRTGSRLTLNPGERYTMSGAMSSDWKGGSADAGFTVEFEGTLATGRKVRICFLFADAGRNGEQNWGIASCAVIAEGQEQLMFSPF